MGQAYVYDIRSGSYLHKLTGHTDTVLAVAFHPQFPQVMLYTVSQRSNTPRYIRNFLNVNGFLIFFFTRNSSYCCIAS